MPPGTTFASRHDVLQAFDVAQECTERRLATLKIERPYAASQADHDGNRFLCANRRDSSGGLIAVELRRLDWDQLKVVNNNGVTGAESLHRRVAQTARIALSVGGEQRKLTTSLSSEIGLACIWPPHDPRNPASWKSGRHRTSNPLDVAATKNGANVP